MSSTHSDTVRRAPETSSMVLSIISAVHVRVRSHLLEDLLGALTQVEAVSVDEGQLPLHAQRGPG